MTRAEQKAKMADRMREIAGECTKRALEVASLRLDAEDRAGTTLSFLEAASKALNLAVNLDRGDGST